MLTAAENVEVPMIACGVPRGERRRRALALLARALANDPLPILADEPTGDLDSETGQAIIDLLADLNRDGWTLVVVTHDPQVTSAARRVISLLDGRIMDDPRTEA